MKRNFATFLLIMISLTTYGVFLVYAAAPPGGYNPGQTLDPDCAPGDVDCIVKLPTPITGDWVKTVNGVTHDIAGNVAITTDNVPQGITNKYFWGVETLDALVGDGTSASPLGLAFLFENSNKGTVSLGTGATSDSSHSNSIFIGLNSGTGSANVSGSAFIGTNAGANSNADYSNFMGNNAGADATNADNSNFFGFNAGASATNANDSSFFGNSAGYGATNANNANFFGQNAGRNASGADCSNFFGNSTGADATLARCSNFVGNFAGASATNAQFSNFLGTEAGRNAWEASSSNFIGYQAGFEASSFDPMTATKNANFLGYQAGYQATDAANSSFIGYQAGYGAANANSSNFVGFAAGYKATDAFESNFIGATAGYESANANWSNFIGVGAGQFATNASYSNFMGVNAGEGATNANSSNFIGYLAGLGAVNAANSNFIGYQAGYLLTSASQSNIIGYQAGLGTTGLLAQSNVFGYQAGTNMSFASDTFTNAQSDFIGYQAGRGSLNLYQSFIGGYQAGMNTNGKRVTAIGYQAGSNSVLTSDSVFIGYQSGLNSQASSRSIFIGSESGRGVSSASQSIFIGTNAGQGSLLMNNSVIIGDAAGRNFNNLAGSDPCGDFTPYCGPVIIGHNAGVNGRSSSNFMGSFNPVVIGAGAGFYNTNASGVMIGYHAGNGYGAGANAGYGVLIGHKAGMFFNGSTQSTFFGSTPFIPQQDSTLIGFLTGYGTTSSTRVLAIGQQAASLSTRVTDVIALGLRAGASISNVNNSIFLGSESGLAAREASRSIFIGTHAGGQSLARTLSNPTIGFTSATDSSSGGSSYIIRGAMNARNSIFIGDIAGAGDWVDNAYIDSLSSNNDYSILIGPQTSTGSLDPGSPGYTFLDNHKNSIALGAYATNTAQNQFMIGSTERPINEMVIMGTGGQSCTLRPDNSAFACSSDENLKTNFQQLSAGTLDALMKIEATTYLWNQDPADAGRRIGFRAQNIQSIPEFASLVSTGPNGYLQVNYAGMTPVLVKAIQELNLKMNDFASSTSENSLRARLIAWFGDVGNGITSLFVKAVHTETIYTEQLCIKDICLTDSEIQYIIESRNGNQIDSNQDKEEVIIPNDEIEELLEPIEASIDPELLQTPSDEMAIPIEDSVDPDNTSGVSESA